MTNGDWGIHPSLDGVFTPVEPAAAAAQADTQGKPH